ncbi:MAG: outer membrane beta-barrel protein [Bacteroidota bacterium]
MSDERKFDEYIRKEFSDFSPAVSPQVWDNIVAKRSPKRPAGFWAGFLNPKNISLLTGLLFLGGTTVFLLTKNSDEANKQQTDIVSNIPNSQNPTINSAELGTTTNSATNSNELTSTTQTIPEDPTNNITASNIPQKHSANILSSDNNDEGKIIYVDNDNLKNTIDSDEDLVNAATSTPNNLLLINNDEAPLLVSESQSLLLQKRNCSDVKIPGCPTVEEQAAGNKKYVEVYLSPDFTLRNFSDTTQSSVYLQKRKASTEVSSAYSAGIRFGRVFNNGISVKAGLNYSQINEKFTFIQSNLSQVTYVIDPVTGDTTGSYTVSGTRKKTTYNKYRTLDIPLLMGYELGNGRLHVNINAGAMVNIYSWQRGEVLDTNYLPVSITTGKSSSSPYQFKTNVGMGLTGGVGVYYKLTNQLHIWGEPYFRYNLKPMSKQSLTLEQKYNTIGMRFGVRLDLE